jgi:hypothetical protein
MSNLIPHQSSHLDFNTAMQVSQMLAKSSLVPSAYRGKPENILLATLAGQPFGWDPTMAMRSFHVIEGQPSLKPEIMLALVRRAGHSVQGETTTEGATITGTRRDTGDKMTVSYTLEDARRANLLGKSVWKQYPASMCWARALSQLCRMLFPDVVLGAGYTPEELGATVTSDGEVVEATIVSAPIAALPAEPWEDDTLSAAEAKKELVEAAGGDIAVAKELWNGRGSARITRADLDKLLSALEVRAADETDDKLEDEEVAS